MLVAPAEQHEAAVVVRGCVRAPDASRVLPTPGSPAHEHDGRAVVLRLFPRVGEPPAFRVAARERQLAGDRAQRGRESEVASSLPVSSQLTWYVMTASASPFSVSSPTTENERSVRPRAETAYEVVAHDLTAVGRVAQPARSDDRRAVAVAVGPRDVTRADPDAHLEAPVVRVPGGWCAAISRWIAIAREDRVGRTAEGRHDAVTEALDEAAAVAGHDVGEDVFVAAHEFVGRGVAEPRPQRGTAHDVSEQHGRGARRRFGHTQSYVFR